MFNEGKVAQEHSAKRSTVNEHVLALQKINLDLVKVTW